MYKNFRKLFFSKIVSSFTILALLLVVIGPQPAYAASVTSFSVVLAREKASTAGNQLITFTVPAAIASGETLILTYNNSTSVDASLTFTDIDLADDAVDVTLAAAPSGATWGVVRTSATVITFTNGTTAVASSSVVTIEIGTNATNQSTGVFQVTNGTAGTTTLVLSGTMGTPDITGTASMSIIDDDQVSVTATVNQTITFDIDAAVANGETATPYSVALGTITTSDVRVSGTTDSINAIWLEGDTNAGGGMAVTVASANGANGLVSTAVSADKIPSATTTMVAGTANYGLCIATASLVGWTRATGYVSDTCATNSATNGTRALTTTATAFLNSAGAPLASTSLAEVIVNAENSSITPAHTDYTDTLTFIATGTF
ncbi:MAG: hypothetical protein Q8O46_04115 [bacterium]|nr:hypothetical protein [bacterium]